MGILTVEANLMGNPNGFAFSTNQSGSIVNTGDLAVPSGESIALVGGTVINTGTLSAPGGNITIAAVPGKQLVRITQEGSLLSLDLPAQTEASLNRNAQPLTPLSLPQLLTGGNLNHATGVVVENGIVRLTGSNLPIENGDVVAKEVTAHTVTLSAANNLTLVQSNLQTTGDMQLLAQNTVQARDSEIQPFIAQAGGELVIQGNQKVDIFALNHPASGLFSGGDTVLRSANPVIGDAHYITGGSFRIEQLNGIEGNLVSPTDPIILALGDVTIGNYEGASLHILAGGAVNLGTVIITGTETGAEGVDFIREAVQLSDGTEIAIDGNTQLTLDVRAGVDRNLLGGLLDNRLVNSPPASLSEATSANITIDSISILTTTDSSNSVVLLTNQYNKPNTSPPSGTIQVKGEINNAIDNESSGTGLILIDSRTSIKTLDITSNNNTIKLLAKNDINAGKIDGTSSGPLGSEVILKPVILFSETGNITVKTIEAAGRIDIKAPKGLFQATDTLDLDLEEPSKFLATLFGSSGFDDLPFPLNPTVKIEKNSDIEQFLKEKGVLDSEGKIAPNNPYPSLIFVDNNGDRRAFVLIDNFSISILARSDGSASSQSDDNKISIEHKGAPVNSNPNLNDNSINISGGSEKTQFVGPQITRLEPSEFEIVSCCENDDSSVEPQSVLVYQTLSESKFSSDDFPSDVSGTVGAIVRGLGSNASLDALLYTQPFVATTTNTGGDDMTGDGNNGGMTDSNNGIGNGAGSDINIGTTLNTDSGNSPTSDPTTNEPANTSVIASGEFAAQNIEQQEETTVVNLCDEKEEANEEDCEEPLSASENNAEQKLLRLELKQPTGENGQPNPATLPSSSLPGLLTGGEVRDAARVRVNSNGNFELKGTDVE